MSTSTTDTIDHRELGEYAKKSYRYLRIGLIVVLLALLAAVVIERTHAAGWDQSISAYFYTPVHRVFGGALVALGVCLVAIHGNTDVEEVLLNVGGALAPIVAFVPTSVPSPAPWRSGRCRSRSSAGLPRAGATRCCGSN